jgi:hypothetical protein
MQVQSILNRIEITRALCTSKCDGRRERVGRVCKSRCGGGAGVGGGVRNVESQGRRMTMPRRAGMNTCRCGVSPCFGCTRGGG